MLTAIGPWRGNRVTHEGSEACVIWQPLAGDPEVGYMLDFPPADIDDLIELLHQLKTAKPEEIEIVPEHVVGLESQSDISHSAVSGQPDEEGYGHGV